jgi:prepilin-type N-terminal cleavage/methylation domain-containing protein
MPDAVRAMRRCPRDWQRGMTLIELLVSLAVTSILLVGLGGVLFPVSSTFKGWTDRLERASTGTSLATSLQADSHRYVVCSGFEQQRSFLDFCPADAPQVIDTTPAAVHYEVSSSAPYVISRKPAGQSAVFLVRSPGSRRPQFWADCVAGGSTWNTFSGHIHLYNLRLDDGGGGSGGTVSPENFSVYYTAPWASIPCP